jgi:hypothetical protein
MSAEIPAGAMRFNSDSQKLEYWNGSAWFQVHTATPNLATAGDPTPGVRGIWCGGYAPGGSTNEVRYINIASTGDTQDFGDLNSGVNSGFGSGQAASSTRALFMSGGGKFHIDYVTFASTGNTINFGNSTISSGIYSAALSNSTRGIQSGGWGPSGVSAPSSDIIEYVTIASTGNAIDFGNLSTNVNRHGGAASPTRGIFFGGRTSGPTGTIDDIQFITTATLGNAQVFGELTSIRDTLGSCSNATRAISFGGRTPSVSTHIEYVTIASTGDTTNFGDLGTACDSGNAVNSPTRGVHAISRTGGGDVNTLEYINIATTGNAADFGDANNNKMRHAWPASNGHGGL